MPRIYATGEEHHQYRHGMHNTPEYICWRNMKQRCYDRNSTYYKDYGGRGVKVCDRWHDFVNFFADMGSLPSPKHTLDRFPDNDGNYEPGNCRWATRSEQALNRRNARIIEIDGVSLNLWEWADLYGMNPKRVHYRINTLGWDAEKALTTTKGDSGPCQSGSKDI